MSTTNWLFYVNFGVFAVFLTLFITELMGAVLLLIAYEPAKRKVLSHIVPIWEVTGTFAAFWVVTADFSYPSMLLPVATLLAGPIVVFLLLLVARNASISFAEYILRGGWLNEKRLYQAYALSTLGMAVVVVMILSAIVSGAGVDLAATSFSPLTWLLSPASVPYLAGVLLIGAGLAPVFYDLRALRRRALPLTAAGVLVEAAALYLYSPSLLSVAFLVPALLTVLPALLYLVPRAASVVADKLVFGAWTAVILFSQSYLVYPTAFGGKLAVDSVTTTGPMVGAFYTLTVAGVVIVGALMAFYFRAARRSSDGGEAATSGTATYPAHPGLYRATLRSEGDQTSRYSRRRES